MPDSRVIALALAATLACGSRTALDTTVSYGHTDHDASSDGGIGHGGDGGGPFAACAATTTMTLATYQTQRAADDLVDQVAFDDAFVYFHATASILRVPKDGGPLQVIVDKYWPGVSWPDVAGFALSGSTITFIANDALAQIATSGGATISQSQLPFANGDHVSAARGGFWAWNDAFMLANVDWTGKPIAPLLTAGAQIVKVIDDGARVWVPTFSGLHRVEAGALVSASSVCLTDLVDDGDVLYGAGGDVPSFATHTRVYRVDKATDTPTVLVDDGKLVWGVAVDHDEVYFTERDGGAAARVSKSGGTPTVIGAAANAEAIGVAVDDVCVYWTVYDKPNGPAHLMAAPKR